MYNKYKINLTGENCMKKKILAFLMSALVVVTSVPMMSDLNLHAAAAASPVITQIPGTDRTESEFDGSFLSVSGFAKTKVNDRSEYKEGDAEYAVATNEEEFLGALCSAKAGGVKVIEIRNDLYLGWNELSKAAKDASGGMITQYDRTGSEGGTVVANPTMIESGISTLTISGIEGLTIFSTNSSTIRHAEIKLNPSVKDIVIRNLNFTDVWEWDDWRKSGFGSNGGHGTSKRSGFTYLKINGANDVWIDHCNFGISFDGNVDIENGSSGVSITWCKFGDTDYSTGSMLYRAIDYFEDIYQESKVDKNVSSFIMYGIARDNGLTKEQIANYMGYHKKCHLMGAGDKDTWLYKDLDEEGNTVLKVNEEKTDANERIRVSLGYNSYTNMGSRLPLIRGGVCHLYNCYFDNSAVEQAGNDYNTTNEDGLTVREQIDNAGGATHFLSRGLNPRCGAATAADTCDFYCVESPLFYAEKDGDMGDYTDWFGYNYGLIVNSRVQRRTYTSVYEGSSWDNNGVNEFTKDVTWQSDKPTLGNWKWGQEGDNLSYAYKTFALDEVKDNTEKYGGCGAISMSAEEWLKTEYASDFKVICVDDTEEVPVETIDLNYTERTIYLGEYLQLYEKVTPSNTTQTGDDYVWQSSDESVATVSAAGLVKPLKEGKATITVTSKGGKNASCEVTVERLPETLTVSKVPSTLYFGDIFKLDAVIGPESVTDKSVYWESLSSGVEVLDSEGVFQINDNNSTSSKKFNLRVYSCMKGNRLIDRTINKTVSIKATKAPVKVTGIESVESEYVMLKGDTVTVDAVVVPQNASNQKIYYGIENTDIATVDENGCVTALEYGETTLCAVSMNYGYETTYKIKVVEKLNEEEPSYVFEAGDAIVNGKVDLYDAKAVLMLALGVKVDVTEEGKLNADFDKSGRIDLTDAKYTLKKALGIIDA